MNHVDVCIISCCTCKKKPYLLIAHRIFHKVIFSIAAVIAILIEADLRIIAAAFVVSKHFVLWGFSFNGTKRVD
jgi:hypothetical protein